MEPARIALRVMAGGRRSEIVGPHGAGWRVRVASPPENGRANAELVALVAGAVGVPRRRVTLVRGAAARDKVIEIDGMTAAEAARRLEANGRKGDT